MNDEEKYIGLIELYKRLNSDINGATVSANDSATLLSVKAINYIENITQGDITKTNALMNKVQTATDVELCKIANEYKLNYKNANKLLAMPIDSQYVDMAVLDQFPNIKNESDVFNFYQGIAFVTTKDLDKQGQ